MTKLTIQEYLSQKGIAYRESGQELITKCLFNEKITKRSARHYGRVRSTNHVV